MRLRSRIIDALYVDATEAQYYFAPGLPDESTRDAISDSFTESSHGVARIAASGVFTVPFGTVGTAGGLFLSGSASMNVNLNALGNILVTVPTGSGTSGRAKLHIDSAITSIVITNPSATAVLEVEYCIWGDAA